MGVLHQGRGIEAGVALASGLGLNHPPSTCVSSYTLHMDLRLPMHLPLAIPPEPLEEQEVHTGVGKLSNPNGSHGVQRCKGEGRHKAERLAL